MNAITTAAPTHSLRERMVQDMTMRGFGAHTQKDYIRHVRSFAAFLGRPPDTATMEDLRRYQIDSTTRNIYWCMHHRIDHDRLGTIVCSAIVESQRALARSKDYRAPPEG